MALARDASEQSDAELLRRFRAGDKEAFAAIYDRFFRRLVGLCLKRVNDRQAAEDIAQEAMLRALNKLGGVKISRSLWSWLALVASRLCIDHLRSNTRRDHAEMLAAVTPRNEHESVEERDALIRVLQAVPRRERIAFGLRYLEDWDAKEAAEFLQVNRNAFDQALFQSRRLVRAEYRRVADGLRSLLPVPIFGPFRRWIRRLADSFAPHRGRQAMSNAEAAGPALAFGPAALAAVAAGLVTAVAVVGATVFGGDVATGGGAQSGRDSPEAVAEEGVDGIDAGEALPLLPADREGSSDAISFDGNGLLKQDKNAPSREEREKRGWGLESPPIGGEPTEDDCQCVGVWTDAADEMKRWSRGQAQGLGRFLEEPPSPP